MAKGTNGETLDILVELSEVFSQATDQNAALVAIAHLCKRSLSCQLCTITSISLDGERLFQTAVAGLESGAEHRSEADLLGELSNAHGFLDMKLIREGQFIERYNIDVDGQGVANPATANKYGLHRMMAQPLLSGNQLKGYLNIFCSGNDQFTRTEKNLLRVFAHQTVNLIEHLRKQSYDLTLRILGEISHDLSFLPPAQSLRRVAQGVCKLLDVPTCIVWEYDEMEQKLRVAAMSEDDDDYRKVELDPTDPFIQERIYHRQPIQIDDVTSLDARYVGKEEAKKRGWVTLLTVPMYIDEPLSGMLDVYTKAPRQFKEWEKESVALFAQETALVFHGFQKRVEELNRMTQELTEARDENELFTITLRRALELVGCDRGWISKLDVRTGELNIVAQHGNPKIRSPLRLGQGITGRALEKERPWRINDVRQTQFYEEFWADTRSELAIPLVIQNTEVRVERAVQRGSKRLGVLNIESPIIGSFFSLEEGRLETLVREAALVFDRIETDRKSSRLAQIEAEFARIGKLQPEHILNAITETLGFDFVNISLINPGTKRIKSAYIAGVSKADSKLFKRLADYSLEEQPLGIQAHIVQTRCTEVPGETDPRFDQKIHRQFGQDKLIRVFVPIVSPVGNRVVGTVEAGYNRLFRPFIYERDVRILNGFVDFVTAALEQTREGVLARIMHDLRAPAAALLSDVEYLSHKFKDLPDYRIQNKFDDLMLDSELVLLQVSEVERFLGLPTSDPVSQRTVVYRDILIKCVNQIRGLVSKNGFDTHKIHYNPQDAGKMVLYLDPARLNNVVLNLLMNSIKYAEDDPAKFAIRIDLEETRETFILKFKDWGIGIKSEYRENIFDEGFRTPEARAKNVTGSGLGLSISRRIMREMGGDVVLANNYKPTEFHLILPKSLKEQR